MVVESASSMSFLELCQYYWYEKADPRTRDFPITNKPWLIPSIVFAYLYFVLRCGPRFMKDRPAYSLTTFTNCKYYNLFQVVSNAILAYRALNAGWFTELTIYCIPFTYDYSPSRLKVITNFKEFVDSNNFAKSSFETLGNMLLPIMWWALTLRITDFTETVVFVLRKKYNQVSFLHLYHHVAVVLLGWAIFRYTPTEFAMFFIMVNSIVHVIMYTYYYLSTFKGQVQSYIRKAKPFITIIQMVQFVILMIYNLQAVLPSCDIPKPTSISFLLNLIMNFVLFYNFYKKTYTKKSKKA